MDSNEIEKVQLKELPSLDLPPSLNTFLQEFITMFKSDIDSNNPNKIKLKLEAFGRLYEFFNEQRNKIMILYYLSHIKMASFGEIKSKINVSDNSAFSKLLNRLKEEGYVRQVSDLNGDVRFRKEINKRILKKDTRSYWELVKSIDLCPLEGFLQPYFKDEVLNEVKEFENAANELNELKRKEALRQAERTRKARPLFEKILDFLEPQIGKSYKHWNLLNEIRMHFDIGNGKARTMIQNLTVKGFIKDDGERLTILNFINPNSNEKDHELDDLFGAIPDTKKN